MNRAGVVSAGEHIYAVRTLGESYSAEEYVEAINHARARGAGEEYATRVLGPEIRVERLKGGQSYKGIVLSSKLWGYRIHWDQGIRRSEPCHGPENNCSGCFRKVPPKIVFYLHMLSLQKGQCFLELTPDCARRFQDLLEGEPSYRGFTMEFRRTAADKGRMLCALSEYIDKKSNLPPEKDPEETLAVLWQWGRK